MPTQPITARELRIGNLINYKGRAINVTMVGEFGIQSKTRVETINAKFATPDLSGIPLTPEWLERFGFEKRTIDRYVYFELKTGNTVFNFGGDVLSFGVQGVTNVEWVEYNFNSVHQLQNLYFALTGQDLKVHL